MTKISRRKLSNDSWSRFKKHFWQAVALIKSEVEAQQFFYDLLTPTEIKMLSKRLEAAKLLVDGKSYDEIRKELCLGNSTIANVSNWLEQGSGSLKRAAEHLSKFSK